MGTHCSWPTEEPYPELPTDSYATISWDVIEDFDEVERQGSSLSEPFAEREDGLSRASVFPTRLSLYHSVRSHLRTGSLTTISVAY